MIFNSVKFLERAQLDSPARALAYIVHGIGEEQGYDVVRQVSYWPQMYLALPSQPTRCRH